MSLKKEPLPPIAIIGMGMRLPGGVSTSEDFWSLLVNKKSGKCRVPSDRYNVDAFYGDEVQRQAVATDQGHFLQDVNLKTFDAGFFSLSRTEVETLDPQQRLLLEVVWECMENAGQVNWRGSNIGCYVGAFGEDWHDLRRKDTHDIPIASGDNDFGLSNRISYEYDLKGPSMTIRTACSSSLTGLHEACQVLYNGECSAVIVAGTNLIMDPSMTMMMSELGVLSPTGSCKAFDADADGYSRGEAVNAVLIKLLEDAIRDNDPIRAVIRSTAVNCDGKTLGMSTPSVDSQMNMMRKAYELANLDIWQTPYVECHCTGTQVGDAMEGTSVASVFGEFETFIGSVKTNVGHSEGASGITSLIKAVLTLENKIIPPNINFSKPNPKIPFQKGNLKVPVDVTPWPKDRVSRVSVNSFGVGGSNAHVVIDAASSFGISRETRTSELDSSGDEKLWPHLLPISANNAESLRMRTQGLCHYLELNPSSLCGVAHTLGSRREHLTYRTFCIARAGESALEFETSQKANATPPKAVFVFNGQGAQWFGMGKSLIQSSQSFRQDIREMDRVLQGLQDPPPWTIEDILCAEKDVEDLVSKPEFAQPLCMALQIALVNLLAKCGVSPSAVVGHSSGELAGAYAAGAVTVKEAILTSYCRGMVTKLHTREGGMAAVELDRDSVLPFLVDGVTVACLNSPMNVTISGNEDAIERTLDRIKAKNPDIFTRKLRVGVAYHSSHMYEVADTFEEMLKLHITGREAHIPFYSSVTGQRVANETCFGPEYWKNNLVQPVLFSSAVQALLDDLECNVTFLEVGPHSVLQGPLRQIIRGRPGNIPSYIPTLTRHNDCAISMLTAVGRLYTLGHRVDFSFINPQAPVVTNLPNYPWDHSAEYWKESRISRAWRQKRHPHHELLGSRCLENGDAEPVWRNLLDVNDTQWLSDHKIVNDIVFPCTGYISMVGEAIRQMSDSEVYTIRNLVIKSAMVLQESDNTEIITTMRPSRLTDIDNSSWYDFSISSFNGTSWLQHCVGQGRPGEERTIAPKSLVPYPRKLSEEYWYERMRHLGLNYGPQFQGLKDISADVKETVAGATIRNDRNQHQSRYSIHPTTLDLCLQLSAVAMSTGVARRLHTLVVPKTVRHLCVKPGGPSLIAKAEASTIKGIPQAKKIMAATENNEVLVTFEDVTFIPLDVGDKMENMEPRAVSRLEWHPDIDFLDMGKVIHRKGSNREGLLILESLTTLYTLQILDSLKSLDPPTGHLAKFASWLQREKDNMVRGVSQFRPEAHQWVLLDAVSRNSLLCSINRNIEALENPNVSAIQRICQKLSDHENIQGIFTGTINPVQLMLEDGDLAGLYNFIDGIVNPDEFLKLCSHAQPTLKVLEVGAGTGATTEQILKALISKEGTRMYSQYTFTDLSPGFFAGAEERFKSYTGVTYKALDITKSPAEQGFDLGSYDLIVASNVLHATPSLGATLRNVRSLLRSGGRLYLQEIIQPLAWGTIRFITGWLPGWWLGEGDGRPDEPLASVERWNQEFCQAGFSEANTVVPDDDFPYQFNAVMTTTAIEPTVSVKAVTFLYDKQKHEFAQELARRFEQEGIEVHWTKICDNKHIPGQDVISAIDLEGPYFHDILPSDYEVFRSYLSELKAGMLWLTRPAQIHCVDPRYGLVIGLARTIRSELSLDFSTVELQTLDPTTTDAVLAVFRKFQRRSPSSEYNVEPEFAVHNGIIHTARYHWATASDGLESTLRHDDAKRLTIDQHGKIDSLFWVQHKSTATLEANEVEMSIHCAGLNFKDVLTAMGILQTAGTEIGIEGSGFVTGVGSAVSHVKVGDRAIALGAGLFTTRKVVLGHQVVRIPDSLSFEDAATMPCVYATVIHSIINVGRLAKGQSILIHSACGGVGLAAIQICQMIGADIYVTVGNEEKAQYLMDSYDLPRARIFQSRNVSFKYDILEATGGRGVDMVLNSLSGELLHASWQCVAKFGKMMEIGKRDLLGRGLLALDPFVENRTFYGVDLAELGVERPEEIRRLMDQCMEYFQDGHIKPIRPVQIFPAQQVAGAFRFMQQGKHMGKIVVSISQETEEIPAVKESMTLDLSTESTYILVGGLGGLGKAVTTWMTERGARHFVFLSRSAGKSSEDQSFISELEYQGCHVVTVAGDVTQLSDVQKAVQAAPTPIAGAIQMSMVLKDLPLLDISYEDWNVVQNPKVKGTWNLHQALSDAKLDFFILFSSISGLCGQPGQASYASANAFLDSFVQYRHSLNLPCSVIDIGVMEGIGFVSRSIENYRKLRAAGSYMLQEQALMDAIHISIRRSKPFAAPSVSLLHQGFSNLSQIGLGMMSSTPISDPNNRIPWKDDIRMSLCRQLEVVDDVIADSKNSGLGKFLNSVANNPNLLATPASLEFVTQEIRRILCGYLMRPEEDLDLTATLTTVGVDSLVAIEIRNWMRRNLRVAVSVLEITNSGTLEQLGKLAIVSLQTKHMVNLGSKSGNDKTHLLEAHSPDDAEKDTSTASHVGSRHPSKIDLAAEVAFFMESDWALDGLLTRPVTTLRDGATVFLTGASGYLGIEILRQLLRSDRVDKVVALVRARDAQHGLDRIREAAQIAEWWQSGDEHKVEVWPGDLSKDDMGLGNEQLSRLRGESDSNSNIDAIVHNGAVVGFMADYDKLLATNVGSTVELLRIAASSPVLPKFVYISGGCKRRAQEDVTAYAARVSTSANGGYVHTKYVSENIVADIASKLPKGQNRVSIVKPGFIIGRASTGVANISDMIWSVVATATALQKYPEDRGNNWLYLVEVDSVAAQVTKQLWATEDIPSFVDIVDGLPVSRFWELVNQELALPCLPVPRKDWIEHATVQIDELGKLHPLWSFGDMLRSADILLEPPPQNFESSRDMTLSVRSNIRYLNRLGFIRPSLRDMGQLKAKALGGGSRMPRPVS